MLSNFMSLSFFKFIIKFYHLLFIYIYFSPCLQLINGLSKGQIVKLKIARKYSKSQLMQDVFVFSHLNYKDDGFFVEFGATNGVELSNTYLLEKKFFWKGILAEPAKIWHLDLKKNRAVFIEEKCIWKNSGSIVEFNEVSIPELSSISYFHNKDDWALLQRKNFVKYPIETISLIDLLDKYHAPKVIDYLSIDTEGSEFEILSNFDFNKYQFRVITCEHNYTSDRKKIYNLLIKNGYIRKYSLLSKWDDWYVLDDRFASLP